MNRVTENISFPAKRKKRGIPKNDDVFSSVFFQKLSRKFTKGVLIFPSNRKEDALEQLAKTRGSSKDRLRRGPAFKEFG
jgi:hypothetical protein